ncbi:MAG: UDP-N-acetylglucosamine 4,6-dehydratase (inverting) [Rhodospirillaceae bacterium]|nr:MAG: UDP-N-acetylglucosamine 4,6-dehydratase (inverting) [Rhodospirillaceae bacterium]
MLDGASIFITGGTGSFGKRFVQHVLENFSPRKLIIFSRDELKQYEMAQRFSVEEYPCLRYFLGDVRDVNRLRVAMRNVDYVIHAAALKQVPAAEYNPTECIRTNVLGTENLVTVAVEAGVKKMIALSTDKAANPINLYGASKLASDKIMVAGNSLSGADGCRYSVVRYGNVVGSRGSVVPFFQKLIDEKADALPITDDRMTRFWITLDDGVRFVLTSLVSMKGGEVFVPKIPSMRMTDLAEFMAPDMPTKIIGIRPGEKLHETMITIDDARHTYDLGDRYVICPEFPFWQKEWMREGKPVGEGFQYASDTNTEWLDLDGFNEIMSKSS